MLVMFRRALVLCAAVALTASLNTHAHAAPAPRPQTCVDDVVTHKRTCFSNFRDATDFATNGAVKDAPLDAKAAVTSSIFRNKVNAAASLGLGERKDDFNLQPGYVIGAVIFQYANYGGATAVAKIPHPCVKNGVYDFYFNFTGTVGTVSPYANCWVWLHADNQDNREGPYKSDTPSVDPFWMYNTRYVGLS